MPHLQTRSFAGLLTTARGALSKEDARCLLGPFFVLQLWESAASLRKSLQHAGNTCNAKRQRGNKPGKQYQARATSQAQALCRQHFHRFCSVAVAVQSRLSDQLSSACEATSQAANA